MARTLYGVASVGGAASGCESPVAEFDHLADDADAEYRLSGIGGNVPVSVNLGATLPGNETSAVGFPTVNKLFVSFNSDPGDGSPWPDASTVHCG